MPQIRYMMSRLDGTELNLAHSAKRQRVSWLDHPRQPRPNNHAHCSVSSFPWPCVLSCASSSSLLCVVLSSARCTLTSSTYPSSLRGRAIFMSFSVSLFYVHWWGTHREKQPRRKLRNITKRDISNIACAVWKLVRALWIQCHRSAPSRPLFPRMFATCPLFCSAVSHLHLLFVS